MRFIADLHIHSRYSRATSRDMSPEALWKWAQFKGISVIGTGDFTHPQWLDELQEKVEPAGQGLFRLKKKFLSRDVPESCRADVFFLLSAEISCVYSKRGRTRKVHSIILVPGFGDAQKINRILSGIGNLTSDGRPILGLDAKELLKIVSDVSPDGMLIPAHAWTPHFSVFGAASGFDTLEECFEDLTPSILAIETGLSSDPAMNRRLSALDRVTLLSNSDAHSPAKIGREASIFDTEPSYPAIREALRTRKGFLGTIEFFPEEGKYHYDGHRSCGVSLTPEETMKHRYLCPVCGKKVTIGVMHRVEKLADREEGFRPEGAPGFSSVIPLPEIIGETLKVGVNSKAVEKDYFSLLERLGNEFRILLECSVREIEKAGSSRIAEAISRMRSGDVHIAPGFDGEFGKVRIFEDVKKKKGKRQRPLS
ncbi:MAG TPA: endonuclease Q family protein [Thermodesulfovibrionales bacterium]|nr:endonuclease Q family protein [Thermodesulfovibrionales bacterium]